MKKVSHLTSFQYQYGPCNNCFYCFRHICDRHRGVPLSLLVLHGAEEVLGLRNHASDQCQRLQINQQLGD